MVLDFGGLILHNQSYAISCVKQHHPEDYSYHLKKTHQMRRNQVAMYKIVKNPLTGFAYKFFLYNIVSSIV